MNIADQIQVHIRKSIDVEHMELINESIKHQGHIGDDGSGQTHFKAVIVSSTFEGVAKLERQRLINRAVKSLFGLGLHAFSTKLYTPNEYKGLKV